MMTDDLKKRADEIKNADPTSAALLLQAAQQITSLTEQFTALSKRQSVAGKPVVQLETRNSKLET